MCPKYIDVIFPISVFIDSTIVKSEKFALDSAIWILKLPVSESATACITMWSTHVPCMHRHMTEIPQPWAT